MQGKIPEGIKNEFALIALFSSASHHHRNYIIFENIRKANGMVNYNYP